MREPYTGTHALLSACCNFLHHVRIRNLGPRHADQINQAFANRMAGCRDIGDAGGVKDWQVNMFFESCSLCQPWPDRRSHARHIVHCQADLRIHPPIHGIKEIEHAG